MDSGPCPELLESNPHSDACFQNVFSILRTLSTPSSQAALYVSEFSTKFLYVRDNRQEVVLQVGGWPVV
jgi:hypothetical protein